MIPSPPITSSRTNIGAILVGVVFLLLAAGVLVADSLSVGEPAVPTFASRLFSSLFVGSLLIPAALSFYVAFRTRRGGESGLLLRFSPYLAFAAGFTLLVIVGYLR